MFHKVAPDGGQDSGSSERCTVIGAGALGAGEAGDMVDSCRKTDREVYTGAPLRPYSAGRLPATTGTRYGRVQPAPTAPAQQCRIHPADHLLPQGSPR